MDKVLPEELLKAIDRLTSEDTATIVAYAESLALGPDPAVGACPQQLNTGKPQEA